MWCSLCVMLGRVPRSTTSLQGRRSLVVAQSIMPLFRLVVRTVPPIGVLPEFSSVLNRTLVVTACPWLSVSFSIRFRFIRVPLGAAVTLMCPHL